MKPVIELENVSFAYRTAAVLQDVSLSIMSGDYVGIIGPNGGGKTTLLKLIMGFLEPKKGVVRVFGKPPNDIQERISYVPQAMLFDRQFPISVMELVLGGRLSRLPWYGWFSSTDKVAAESALEKMGISNISHKPIGALSGGQIQRALIARALASHPQLLLLDEPTANVDAEAQGEIYRLLHDLNREMTILMVTHDLHVAIDQVKRVFCVQGRVSSLKPEEVCKHFAVGLYHAPLIKEK